MPHDRLSRPASVSRRRMIQACTAAGAGVALTGHLPVYATQTARQSGAAPLAALNRFPRMVQEFFVRRENEIYEERLKRLARLSSRADAEA